MTHKKSEAGEPEISSEAVLKLLRECKNYGFYPYSPYRSFCTEERLLIAPKGTIINSMVYPGEEPRIHPDGFAIWSIGKAAFDSLHVSGAVDFLERYKSYLNVIAMAREALGERLIDGGIKPVDEHGQAISLDDLDIDDLPASEILSTLLQMLDKSVEMEFSPEYMAELLCFACLEEIAHAIVGYELDGRGAISAAVSAASYLADAQALDPAATRSKEVKRRLAIFAASRRHAADPRQSEKKFVKECFEAWAEDPSRYKSLAAFAQDMLGKCEHLKSAKKIEDWVRAWRRAAAEEAPSSEPSA